MPNQRDTREDTDQLAAMQDPDMRAVAVLAQEITEHAAATYKLQQERAKLVKVLVGRGIPVTEVSRYSGLSRQRVHEIMRG